MLARYLGVPEPQSGSYTGDPLSIPAVHQAVTLISTTIGRTPLVALDDGGRPVDPAPPVVVEPTPGLARQQVLADALVDLLINGNAIFAVSPARSGPVLTPVPSTEVAVTLDRETGERVYQVGQVRLTAPEVVHLQAPGMPGALRGLGVLERMAPTLLARAQAEESWARTSVATGGVPTGILKIHKPRIEAAEAEAEKAKWVARFAPGVREPAVFSDLMDFTPLAWKPVDAELLAARSASVVDVARAFNLSAYWLSAPTGSSMTYSNVSAQADALYRLTLAPLMAVVEAAFTRLLPRGQYAAFDVDTLLRGDQESRYRAWQTALASGFMSVDEVRAREGLTGPVTGSPDATTTQGGSV